MVYAYGETPRLPAPTCGMRMTARLTAFDHVALPGRTEAERRTGDWSG